MLKLYLFNLSKNNLEILIMLFRARFFDKRKQLTMILMNETTRYTLRSSKKTRKKLACSLRAVMSWLQHGICGKKLDLNAFHTFEIKVQPS